MATEMCEATLKPHSPNSDSASKMCAMCPFAQHTVKMYMVVVNTRLTFIKKDTGITMMTMVVVVVMAGPSDSYPLLSRFWLVTRPFLPAIISQEASQSYR